MNNRLNSSARLIALCLVFSFMQAYVAASPVVEGAPSKDDNNSRKIVRGNLIYGTLATINDKAISINGNSVRSGCTVMTGAFLETPAEVGASLQLWPLGRIEIAPFTKIQIDFDKGYINVNLLAGCAILTTYVGVAGSVKTPQGTTEKTGPERRSFVDVCTGEPGTPTPIVGQGAAARAGAGVCWPSMAMVEPAEVASGKGFNPFWFLLGGVPFLVAGVLQIGGDGRPPVASASGL